MTFKGLATLVVRRRRPRVPGGSSRTRTSPNIKLSLGGVMALEQACLPEYREAQCAFKDSMTH